MVHVAGTNGKGSTMRMIEALARAKGYKTGLFTSPHLVEFAERIRVNGEMIPQGHSGGRNLLHEKPCGRMGTAPHFL